MGKNNMRLFVSFVTLLVIIAIYTLLIMTIWNKVLMNKIRGANLQKLDFWDALAVGVFFGLISGGTTVYQSCEKCVLDEY